jgi:hypothetical protein
MSNPNWKKYDKAALEKVQEAHNLKFSELMYEILYLHNTELEVELDKAQALLETP